MLLTTGMLFQSPRSEKFVSDEKFMRKRSTKKMFQSPRSGKFVSDKGASVRHLNGKTSVSIPLDRGNLYQIPSKPARKVLVKKLCFNPLDRGNLYLINEIYQLFGSFSARFNPLDRGNLYLM